MRPETRDLGLLVREALTDAPPSAPIYLDPRLSEALGAEHPAKNGRRTDGPAPIAFVATERFDATGRLPVPEPAGHARFIAAIALRADVRVETFDLEGLRRASFIYHPQGVLVPREDGLVVARLAAGVSARSFAAHLGAPHVFAEPSLRPCSR